MIMPSNQAHVVRRSIGVLKKYEKKGRYGLKAENVNFSKMHYKKFFGQGFLRKWTLHGNGNGNGNINFIGELSSRAHFKGNFMQIKNQIGTMPLKSFVSGLRMGGWGYNWNGYKSPPLKNEKQSILEVWFLFDS